MAHEFSSALLREMHSRRRKLLLKHFPMLSRCPHDTYLSLFDYIDRIPESFFSEEIFQQYLNWLESQHEFNSPRIRDYLVKNEDGLNKAFLFLSEINRYSWHDSFEKNR